MSAITWETVEDAIRAAVVAGTGLDGKHVFWPDHGGPRPDAPSVALAIQTRRGVGQDWVKYRDNPSPTAGRELLKVVQGHRVAQVTMRCWGTLATPTAAAVNPLKVLGDAVDSLPLHYTALDAAGVGIGQMDPVSMAPGSRNGVLEPIATTSLEIHLGAELVGYETYIQYIQIRVNAKNDAGDDLATVETWIPEDPPP